MGQIYLIKIGTMKVSTILPPVQSLVIIYEAVLAILNILYQIGISEDSTILFQIHKAQLTTIGLNKKNLE